MCYFFLAVTWHLVTSLTECSEPRPPVPSAPRGLSKWSLLLRCLEPKLGTPPSSAANAGSTQSSGSRQHSVLAHLQQALLQCLGEAACAWKPWLHSSSRLRSGINYRIYNFHISPQITRGTPRLYFYSQELALPKAKRKRRDFFQTHKAAPQLCVAFRPHYKNSPIGTAVLPLKHCWQL